MRHGKFPLFLGNGKGHVMVELYAVFGPVLHSSSASISTFTRSCRAGADGWRVDTVMLAIARRFA
jgi:hypothetical protein